MTFRVPGMSVSSDPLIKTRSQRRVDIDRRSQKAGRQVQTQKYWTDVL